MQQLSVFLENKHGELIALTKTLHQAQIPIDSITIAETSSFGVVRIITKELQKALLTLKDASFRARIVEVLAVLIENKTGAFHQIVQILTHHGININYCYSFGCNDNDGIFIFSVDNYELAQEVLEGSNFKVVL